ncbi:putative tandem protein 18 [Amphidinium carterae]
MMQAIKERDDMPRKRVIGYVTATVLVSLCGGLAIASLLRSGILSSNNNERAKDAQDAEPLYVQTLSADTEASSLLAQQTVEGFTLYWSMSASQPATCPTPSSTIPSTASTETTTPAPLTSSPEVEPSTTSTTTSAPPSVCTPCTLSAPQHYPLSGCPEVLQCGETCVASLYGHECMKPLSLHLSCPDDSEDYASWAWDLNLTLNVASTWGEYAWIAFSGESEGSDKGPKLDSVVGGEDFDVNCRVCSLDMSAQDTDLREGYIRTTLTFGPNIFIEDSCSSGVDSAPSSGPSFAPSSGPSLGPRLSSSLPSLGPFTPSDGPQTTTSTPTGCKSSTVYEDSIVGYAVFLVSASQHDGPFYLDNSISFISKADAREHVSVDPVSNCGCPEGAYTLEVEAALPSDIGDFVFMVAPVLADSHVLPLGVTTSILQDATTTTTTQVSVTTNAATSTMTSATTVTTTEVVSSATTTSSLRGSSSSTTTTTTTVTTTTTTLSGDSSTTSPLADEVTFTVYMTVNNSDGFSVDDGVLQALVETFASALDVPASYVEVSVVLLRRLATVSRLLTSSGNVRIDITVTVPAGTGEPIANNVTQLTEEVVEAAVVEGLENVGIDSSLYLPILVEQISEPSVSLATTTSSSGVTEGSTSSTTPESSSGDSSAGGSGAIIAAIAVPVAFVLLVPLCVGACYVQRKREHSGSDDDLDLLADMRRVRVLEQGTGALSTLASRWNGNGAPPAEQPADFDDLVFTPPVPPSAPVVSDGWTLHEI